MRVTIYDIADEMGVSATTVYKALNNKPKISEEMRKKIIKKAKEMNYVPNKLAQGLARGIKNIGIIIPREPETYMRYVIDGIEKTIQDLKDQNINIIIKQSESEEETRLYSREFIRMRASGIVILPNQNVPGIRQALEETGNNFTPVAAIINEPLDGTPLIGNIKTDGIVLGKMAAEFLDLSVVKNKKLIMIIPEEDAIIHNEAFESFSQENIYYKRKSVKLYKATGKRESYNLTKRIIEDDCEIGGIYVASNSSIGVCACLEDMNRSDIKVVGHDLYPELAQYLMKGSLKATLFQNQILQSEIAVSRMAKFITGEIKSYGNKLIRPELIMRSNLDCYKGLY